MSKSSNISPVTYGILLILHTAVDFGRNEGIGIAIIQRPARSANGSSILPRKEQKHGIERGQMGAENGKTPERAHMFALILAMGLARNTLKRASTATRIKVQTVTVLCGLPVVVEMINHHLAHGPNSLDSVKSPKDRSMIRRVLGCVKRLSRYKVQISVAEDGGSTADAARVKMMAHQRRKKACRRRRHERRNMSLTAVMVGDGDEEDEAGNEEGIE